MSLTVKDFGGIVNAIYISAKESATRTSSFQGFLAFCPDFRDFRTLINRLWASVTAAPVCRSDKK